MLEEELRLCKIFLQDPNHHPNEPSKTMKKGYLPYKFWVETCNKHNLDLSTIYNNDVRSQEKSPARSPARSQTKSPVSYIYKERLIGTEDEEGKSFANSWKLRALKSEGSLLSRILLSIEDVNFIKNYDYESFINEAIKISNNNGEDINLNYMNNLAGYDIVVEIPKKYTSKQSGNNIIKFHDDKGITNGRLLYNLAPYIKSNYQKYQFFDGLKKVHGNIYKLDINQYGW